MRKKIYVAVAVLSAVLAIALAYHMPDRGSNPSEAAGSARTRLATGTIHRPVRRASPEDAVREELDRQLAADRTRASLEPLLSAPSQRTKASSATAQSTAGPKSLKPSKPPKASKIYRWKDSEGVWHLSDTAPPEGVAAEVVTMGNP